MVQIDRSILINQPVHDVFAFILNFENEPKWAEEVVKTQKTSKGQVGIGTTFTDHVEFMGRTLKSTYEILVIEPNKAITIKTSSGPVPFLATYTFNDQNGVTNLSITAKIEPRGLLKLAAPIIRRQLDHQWERNFENLKKLLEG